MTGRLPVIERRSARAMRLAALAPRVAFYGLVVILSLAGVRAALEGPPAPVPAPRSAPAQDLGAQAFAEGFARAYLAFDARRPERRERALAPYVSDELEGGAGAGLESAGSSRTVLWTAAAAESGTRRRQRTVTVAVETTGGSFHLAVPVERDRRGFLFIARRPALVGPPATSTGPGVEQEREVEDPRLLAVAERAVRNYLGRDRRDLLADLAPGAVVSLPDAPLAVRGVTQVTWAEPARRVAVEVEARDGGGAEWELRYELEVRRRDRWYVRSLHVDPRNRGGW